MGRAQPRRIARQKKAMPFSARPDLESKRGAQDGYCSMIIIPSRRRDPDVICQTQMRRVGKANGSCECAPDGVPTSFVCV
jgi:hypothetical protein